MRKVGSWHFDVYMNGDGSVSTDWEVTEYNTEPGSYIQPEPRSNKGRVEDGGLWDAIAVAADALGIIFPLVPDADLMRLGGHGEEEEA